MKKFLTLALALATTVASAQTHLVLRTIKD